LDGIPILTTKLEESTQSNKHRPKIKITHQINGTITTTTKQQNNKTTSIQQHYKQQSNNPTTMTTDMDMDLFSSFLFDEDDDASKGSGYESDQEDGDKVAASMDGSLTARGNLVVEEVTSSAPLDQMATTYDESELSSLSSDAQPNSNNDSGSGSSSSPSPDSSETGDFDDEEEEEFDMVFLDSKRRLLKRVADIMYADEVYDASIAKNPVRCTTPPIWAEAKEVIEALTGKPVGSSREYVATQEQEGSH
jgi:hypothetical protein